MLILLFLFLTMNVHSEVRFVALTANSSISIPGWKFLVQNIDKTSAGFQQQTTKLVYGSTYTVNVTSDFERQQFHKVVQDPTGNFYSDESFVAHLCSLQEEQLDNYFYEQIPREFESGSTALIPCLVTGIPTPHKHIERCRSKTCSETLQLEFPEHVITSGGHVIVVGAAEQDTGWYRCIGENICGSLASTPIFISVRNKLSKEARNMTSPFYVLSRKIKSTIFEFLETENDYLGSMKELIRKHLTEYQLWKLNTSLPSFNDEVFYLQPRSIYFYFYPPQISPVTTDRQIYGTISHNKSCTTHYNSVDKLRSFVITFTTELIAPPGLVPVLKSSHFKSPEEATVQFQVNGTLHPDHTFQCYKNTVRLLNNWRTKVEMSDQTIQITIKYPLISDEGNYQCSLTYDIVYISSPIFLHIKTPHKSAYRTSADITSTSATLTWDIVPQPGHYQSFQGDYVILLSHHPPLITSRNSVTFPDLTPGQNYTWQVMSARDQTPVTEVQYFTTLQESSVWVRVVAPALSLVVVVLVMVLVGRRCPGTVNKLSPSLEPNYLNLLQDVEAWNTNTDVAIIHTKVEDSGH
ncbi:hypothetical protein ACHWQZ_G015543 [Mnemiopsis leidyi]